MGFVSRLTALFRRSSGGDVLIDELETLLIEADLGPRLAAELCRSLKDLPSHERNDSAHLQAMLKEKLAEHVRAFSPPHSEEGKRPRVILLLGANGVGKTTTLAKLAHHFESKGQKVLAIAGDTFRAAAIEQLKVWGERGQFDVIAQKPQADPAAVVYDGLSAARARGVDLVLIDTAGRLHTQEPLLAELKKIDRVIAKFDTVERQAYLVLDANTGQNGLLQAKVFSETLPIDAVILTKWDGSGKGGVLFAIGKELKLPLAFIGVGEKLDDLVPFNPERFINGLFEETSSRGE